ncbi:MAG: DeoR/GlpR transcriptional regulator [Solobacterium sp.]|nr:DeoR/GlpR transcriptional regulator [Solobacterium sp.]
MKKKTEQRRNEIIELLKGQPAVEVRDLSERFSVSPETIRLDLDFLERKGVLERVHGGAISRAKNSEIPFGIRLMEQNDVKKELCRKLLSFIPNDAVIYIASSSTLLPVVPLLKLKKNLTIVTNSLELVNALRETDHQLLVIGGEYYGVGRRMVGPYAMDMIRDLYFDMTIVGMDGCKNLDGPATSSHYEHVYISHVLQQSAVRILVADQSKLDKTANFRYARFSDFDHYIVDRLTEEHRRELEEKIDMANVVEV